MRACFGACEYGGEHWLPSHRNGVYDADPGVLPAWRAYFTEKPPTVDGAVRGSEWSGWDRARTFPLVSEESPGVLPAGEGYALFDGKDLYLAIGTTADGNKLRRQGGTWGPNGTGGVEVTLARVVGRLTEPAHALRGYPSGKLESVTSGGVDEESAQLQQLSPRPARRKTGRKPWTTAVDAHLHRRPLDSPRLHRQRPSERAPRMISLQLHQATGTILADDVSLQRCEE